jgi:hypothetical protein
MFDFLLPVMLLALLESATDAYQASHDVLSGRSNDHGAGLTDGLIRSATLRATLPIPWNL